MDRHLIFCYTFNWPIDVKYTKSIYYHVGCNQKYAPKPLPHSRAGIRLRHGGTGASILSFSH